MKNLNIKKLVISKRWQANPYQTGLGSYWTWTDSSDRVMLNPNPASETSRVLNFTEVKMAKRNNRLIFGLMVLYLTFFGLISISYGEKEEQKIKVETKEISGIVGGVSFKSISISLSKEEGVDYEQAFKIDENVELKRIKSIKSIAPGDTVSVEYEESTQDQEEVQPDGSVEIKTRLINRVAKVITFLRPASDSLRSGR